MASQQILFAETVAGMKKAFKRKAYESDSDSEIESYSNRGNKLKKRSRFAHKGQLVPNNGPSSYREYVEYEGVRRAIIHRNPPLIDEEGYEIDSDDDDERLREAEETAAELNPYANLHLENLLAPLTASTALPNHPTLSKPFTSKTLTRLVDQSCDIMRKENRSLWHVRHLLTALCGDYTWVPCETLVRPSDVGLYNDDHVAQHLLSLANNGTNANALPPAETNGNSQHDANSGEDHGDVAIESERSGTIQAEDADVPMADAELANGESKSATNGDKGKDTSNDADAKTTTDDKRLSHKAKDHPEAENGPQNGDGEAKPKSEEKAVETTSAPVAEESSGQPASVISDNDQAFIHPMFLAPAGAKPDRDVGLPEPEAEDVRRLLALYVQKQEEVCRGAKKLFLGLLRAEKMRKDVLHWSKAEAHSGPNRTLSDGEDWYDKEEWGLVEDLKKGQDEEEEDTQTTGKKTTRNRRN